MANRVASDTMDSLLDGDYAPRRSNLVTHDVALSDGDTWQERLAVCEGATDDGKPRLLIRSYYRNSRTADRVWDEPPSGASHIRHASAEMRKAANEQLQELQLTLEMIPPETDPTDTTETGGANNTKKDRKGFFGRFRKKEKKTVEVSKDLNLQRAIARSMVDQFGRGGGGGGDPIVYYDPSSSGNLKNAGRDEDEELAMAKALSLSESNGNGGSSAGMTEEEMLQRALEESRKEAATSGGTGVASMPSSILDAADVADASASSSPPTPPHQRNAYKTTGTEDDNNNNHGDDADQKRPAKVADAFDPYSPSKPAADETSKPPSVAPLGGAAATTTTTTKEEHVEERKPGPGGIARRMFGGRKHMETKAGVV